MSSCQICCMYKGQTELTGASHLLVGKTGTKRKTKGKIKALNTPEILFQRLSEKNKHQSKAPKQKHKRNLKRCECWNKEAA